MSKKEKSTANEKTNILQPSICTEIIQEINLSETPFKRILAYLSKVEDPYSFQMDGYQVQMEWMDTSITLQDRVKDIFVNI